MSSPCRRGVNVRRRADRTEYKLNPPGLFSVYVVVFENSYASIHYQSPLMICNILCSNSKTLTAPKQHATAYLFSE